MEYFIIAAIIMPIIVGMIANSKGRSWILWFLYGLILWPIALVHALVLKPLMPKTKGDWEKNTKGPRRCPNQECARVIHGTQENCPYCKTPMNGETIPCPKCSTEMFSNITTCPDCGYNREADPEGLYSDERECPFCAELIKKKAVKCKHCGSDIEPA
ncbi:hypothetical protein [Pseudodesulfovibrio sp. JC047]|uniref:hypothetical protein n=1 Tax=Pseudodesulfovibrio sp. JC047 TaxID=2683199 RepID=UPI00193FF954|nr:hypothetical protein [Pseudodesulfovibrio sp. JC047]